MEFFKLKCYQTKLFSTPFFLTVAWWIRNYKFIKVNWLRFRGISKFDSNGAFLQLNSAQKV